MVFLFQPCIPEDWSSCKAKGRLDMIYNVQSQEDGRLLAICITPSFQVPISSKTLTIFQQLRQQKSPAKGTRGKTKIQGSRMQLKMQVNYRRHRVKCWVLLPVLTWICAAICSCCFLFRYSTLWTRR